MAECTCAKCGEVREICCIVDGEPWCEDCLDKAIDDCFDKEIEEEEQDG